MDFELFANRVKEARKRVGLNQAELAEKLGVGQNTVSNYENATGGKGSAPKLETAAKMAEVLNVSLDWLVGREVGGTMTGKSFLDYLTKILENSPKAYSTLIIDDFLNFEQDYEKHMVDFVKLGKPIPCEADEVDGFSIKLLGDESVKLYEKLKDYVEMRKKLENGGVPQETIDEVMTNMREKIVDNFGTLFELNSNSAPK